MVYALVDALPLNPAEPDGAWKVRWILVEDRSDLDELDRALAKYGAISSSEDEAKQLAADIIGKLHALGIASLSAAEMKGKLTFQRSPSVS